MRQKALGGFRFGRSGGCEMRTFGHRLRNHLNNFRMRMPLNQRAERHHEIDVLVAVEVPDMRSAATLQHHRPRRVHGRAARRRVHAFDQRLLRALIPFVRPLTVSWSSIFVVIRLASR